MRFVTAALFLTATCSLANLGCSSAGGGAASQPVSTTITVGSSALTFTAAVGGAAPATQMVTVANTGSTSTTFSSIAITGPGAASFSQVNSCAPSVAIACTVTVSFTPAAGSGTATASLVFTDNASGSPQSVALTGTTTGVPAASATADCATTTGTGATSTGGPCTALTLQGDGLSAGGFHGYADPSMRKDPNSSTIYLGYSWPHTMPDGTHAVDLHLASSTNNGTSFTYVGPLFQTQVVTQTTSVAYSQTNYSSNETLDLIPIPLTGASAGQTLWVQAHQSYLVKPTASIYTQLDVTGYVSVSAVQLATPAGAGAGTALLALGTAPEARLGANDTDATRNVTQNIATQNTNMTKCGNFGQAALWYQSPTLYLSVECSEVAGGGVDANELAHFLFQTTPTGSDATKWTWTYVAEFATLANAAKFGTIASENTTYQFFTEPEFALTKSGQLVIIMSPSVFAPQTSQQPVIQYGCRVFPVTSLSTSGITLATDTTTGALAATAKTVESDLYAGSNEGPGACTYEPAATTGIILERKYENDPTYGFYIFPVSTGINP